jgi:hypothetical protein
MPGGNAMTIYDRRKRLSAAKYLLVLPLIAIFALPGSAEQLANVTPQQRLASMQAELGVTLDPHAEAPLSIQLPARFTAEKTDLALRFI